MRVIRAWMVPWGQREVAVPRGHMEVQVQQDIRFEWYYGVDWAELKVFSVFPPGC